MDKEYRKAAEKVWRVYYKLEGEERILIIHDNSTAKFAKSLEETATEYSSQIIRFNTRTKAKNGGRRRSYPKWLMDFIMDKSSKLASVDVGIVWPFLDGIHHLVDDPVAKLMESKQYTHIKHVSLAGVPQDILVKVFLLDYQRNIDYSNRARDSLAKFQEVKLTNPAGTDLTLKLDGTWRVWGAQVQYGVWDDMPGFEIETAPITSEGKLVLDGLVGNGFDREYGYINPKINPLTLFIENNRYVDFTMRYPSTLPANIDKFLCEDKNSSRVAELGIGVTIGFKGKVKWFNLEEKLPGIHIGFGEPYLILSPKDRSDTHFDVKPFHINMYSDGRKIMSNDRLLLDNA